VKQGGSLF